MLCMAGDSKLNIMLNSHNLNFPISIFVTNET